MVLDQEDGYWIKIQARQVLGTQNVPHGVRYALTLHAPNGKRLMGYDNSLQKGTLLTTVIASLQIKGFLMNSKVFFN